MLISFGRNLKTHLCWDEDIAKAFVLALDYDRSDVFNLAGENPLTLDEAGRLLDKKVLYLNPKLISPILKIAASLRLLQEGSLDWVGVATKGSIVVSAEKARERLGWEPRFDTPGTLLEFVRQHGLVRGKREG